MLEVLGLEVVPRRMRVHDHLAGQARLGGAAVDALEHRALDLRAGDRRLHEHLAVMLACALDGVLKIFRGADPRCPDRGAAAGGLHEHRIAHLGDLVEHLLARRRRPVPVADHHVGADRQAACCEQELHVLLVHARRAGQDACAGVPDAGHLQQALDRAVLPVLAMQQGQHYVDLAKAGR